uniref:Transcription initiation factor TFIID subunit 1 n=1 Tax=Panagrolaimus sp. ES5 TaxID=591445 RepID=A0AC34FBM2_9BILA
MKDQIEFFLSTDSNKMVYKGSCKVYLNNESKLLLIEPEDEDIKILKIPFCNFFVQQKNFLIHYSSSDSSDDCVLCFSTEKDCKDIHHGILKHQVNVKQEIIDDDFGFSLSNKKFIDILIAVDNAIKKNSNVPERLKRVIAQMMLTRPSKKEKEETFTSEFSFDSEEVQTNQNSPRSSLQSPVDEIRSRKRKYSSSDDYKKEKQCKMEITELDVPSGVTTFELSFDDYYSPTTSQSTFTFSTNLSLQHSIPAQNVDFTFFPTWMSTTELRRFHRKTLSKGLLQSLSADKEGFIDILSVNKHIKEINIKNELPEFENCCPYRNVSALSAKSGTLLFFEYSEEHPPLLNQPGMASKIRNYYKKFDGEDADIKIEFGETSFTQDYPYLGDLKPKQHLQSLENNMFCAPIYQQKFKTTDYLLVISENKLIIRKCSNLFVVGQECPLQEVPNPNSKKASNFARDFLFMFIYRLFWASSDIPRRLKMEDIRKAFPHYPESTLRKRLKICATFIRTGEGVNTNYWVLKEDFCLPTEKEILKLITPEMCCAHYSMMSAKQRLKNAGYGETNILANINESDSDDDVKIEDEIQCAPWNTTKAFLTALQGKCYLDQRGTADPTGCGEAFSYIRRSSKWTRREESFLPIQPQRCTGTNADLRKLPIKEARELCKEYGFPEERINALGRWKVIDLIRKISIQEAKNGADLNGIARFAKSGIRLTQMQQNWKEYCQKIFDVQNQSLSNDADLSSDDENSLSENEEDDDVTIIESEDEESDNFSFASTVAVKREPSSSFDVFESSEIFGPSDIFGPSEFNKRGKIDNSIMEQQNESITVSKKFKSRNIKMENGKEMHDNESIVKEESSQSSESHQHSESDTRPSTSATDRIPESLLNFATINDGNDELVYGENCKVSRKSLELLFERENNDRMKKLKIIRTFRDSNGQEAIRSEMISNSKIIDAYIKIRTTKDMEFIKEYSYNDEEYKKENRKKIRRYQDQLRRIKRKEEEIKLGILPKPSSRKKKPKKELKLKCSSCGAIGHMKTNKNCPNYYSTSGNQQAKPTIGQLLSKNETGELTQIEETKIRIKKSALNLKLRISKNAMKPKKDEK